MARTSAFAFGLVYGSIKLSYLRVFVLDLSFLFRCAFSSYIHALLSWLHLALVTDCSWYQILILPWLLLLYPAHLLSPCVKADIYDSESLDLAYRTSSEWVWCSLESGFKWINTSKTRLIHDKLISFVKLKCKHWIMTIFDSYVHLSICACHRS